MSRIKHFDIFNEPENVRLLKEYNECEYYQRHLSHSPERLIRQKEIKKLLTEKGLTVFGFFPYRLALTESVFYKNGHQYLKEGYYYEN